MKKEMNLIKKLDEIYKECSRENWDGYDANPVSFNAVQEVKRFIRLLPCEFPQPNEILPEPDGDVGLGWYKNVNFIFVISFNERKTIDYAGIFYDEKIRGTIHFEGNSIPQIIRDIIYSNFT